jgi:hypothetical protein
MTPPLAFHPLLIHLKGGVTIPGYYTAGNIFWPGGYRDSDRMLIPAEQVTGWEYSE